MPVEAAAFTHDVDVQNKATYPLLLLQVSRSYHAAVNSRTPYHPQCPCTAFEQILLSSTCPRHSSTCACVRLNPTPDLLGGGNHAKLANSLAARCLPPFGEPVHNFFCRTRPLIRPPRPRLAHILCASPVTDGFQPQHRPFRSRQARRIGK